jgi:hypothetical protein
MKPIPSTEIQVYCSSSFDWKGNEGSCNSSDLIIIGTEHMAGTYNGILIKSSKTGDMKYFQPVFDEDGYDGEFMVYRNGKINVSIWNY